MKPVLAAESIGKHYGRRKVLNSAGLWAHPGRVTALVGRNGAGKSTLIKATVGLVRVAHGVVIFREQRYARATLSTLARDGLFYVPERGLLASWFTVAAHFQLVEHAVRDAHAARAIDRLRLQSLLGRRARALSGGERRRVEIALALARGPVCLLADELFLGLSPTEAEMVASSIRALADGGCAIVISGHEVAVLFDVADDVLWLTDGTTRALGSVQDAQTDDQFRSAYLGR